MKKAWQGDRRKITDMKSRQDTTRKTTTRQATTRHQQKTKTPTINKTRQAMTW